MSREGKGAQLASLSFAAALLALGVGMARADRPTIVEAGDSPPIVNGGFSPRSLPKSKFAQVAMDVSAKVPATLDGSHLPALQELVLELDRNIAIDAAGMPICHPGGFERRLALGAGPCLSSALVGRGTVEVEVEFPEREPFIAKGKLLAFNGGQKGGTTTIFVYAYLSAPVSAAVAMPIEASRIHHGRYGMRWILRVSKIAGGYGSIASFNLTIDRRFGPAGRRQSYLLAKCPDGHLNAKATSIFSDGSKLTGSFVRACTPKG